MLLHELVNVVLTDVAAGQGGDGAGGTSRVVLRRYVELCSASIPCDPNAVCAMSDFTPVKLIEMSIFECVKTEAMSLTFRVMESALVAVATKSRAQSAVVRFVGGGVEEGATEQPKDTSSVAMSTCACGGRES